MDIRHHLLFIYNCKQDYLDKIAISNEFGGSLFPVQIMRFPDEKKTNLYFFFEQIFSLWAFHDMHIMPSFLGGHGSCGVILDNHPVIAEDEMKNWMIAYNMVQFGNHLFALFELVFFRKEEELKYYEYTLHHFMASGLIFYSCFFNFIYVSTLVLILHDIGDIILAGGRSYLDLQNKNKYLVNILMGLAVIVWISSRNFIFPACIIHSIYIRFPL